MHLIMIPLEISPLIYYDISKLNLKPVNSKRILISTAIDCFKERFLFRL